MTKYIGNTDNFVYELLGSTMYVYGSGEMKDFYYGELTHKTGTLNCRTIMETLIIGEGITILPERGFQSATGLKYVSLPSTLTKIGRAEFYNCNLTGSIVIPASVNYIDGSAFQGNTQLTKIYDLHTSLSGVTLVWGVYDTGASLLTYIKNGTYAAPTAQFMSTPYEVVTLLNQEMIKYLKLDNFRVRVDQAIYDLDGRALTDIGPKIKTYGL